MSDDGLRAINEIRKKARKDNLNNFVKNILPLLLKKYVVIRGFNAYIIDNKYKFYPKANSVYLMESNTWIKKYALNWIKKYLL